MLDSEFRYADWTSLKNEDVNFLFPTEFQPDGLTLSDEQLWTDSNLFHGVSLGGATPQVLNLQESDNNPESRQSNLVTDGCFKTPFDIVPKVRPDDNDSNSGYLGHHSNPQPSESAVDMLFSDEYLAQLISIETPEMFERELDELKNQWHQM
jgi:hypothetical protein